MTQAFAGTGRNAKNTPIQNGYDFDASCSVSNVHAAVTAIFIRLQPRKTWALIAETLRIGEHTAKHRAANHRDYTVEEIRLLLQSENGQEVLDILMADAEPRWWRDIRKTIELTRIRAEQAQLQQRAMALDNAPMARQDRRKMKRVIDADRNLSAARAEQETALGILLQNGNGAVVSPMAATAVKAKIPAAGMRAGGRGR
jgi:hypothetical protein